MTDSENVERADAGLLDELPVAYFELDRHGVITRANQLACGMFQIGMEEVLGKTAWEFMAGDQVQSSRDAFVELMQSGGEPAPIRRTLYSADGRSHTYDVFRSLIRDAEGNSAGARHVAIEITEAQLAKEECDRARDWQKNVLDAIAEAVVVTDALGFVRYANSAAEQLTGWRADELVGEVIERRLPVLSYASSDQEPITHLTTLDRRCRGTAKILDRKRYQLSVEFATSPIVDKETGSTTGVVSVLRRLKEEPQA